MKAKMLKIAGVKSEKEFYKKFPDEASFMAKHGKEFKKAMRGTKVEKAQVGYDVPQLQGDNFQPTLTYNPNQFGYNPYANVPYGGRPTVQSSSLPRTQLGNITAGASPAQTMKPNISAAPTQVKGGGFNAAPYMQAGTDIIEGIKMLKEEKDALREARQMNQLVDVQALAASSRPKQQPRRQYLRPEDVIPQPDQMFPSYGVGTNVLAQDGAVIRDVISGNPTEIQNTYAPDNTLYDDLGYEPLNDTDQLKQFAYGGKMQKAEFGNQSWMQGTQFGDIMGRQGGAQFAGSLAERATGGPSGGSKIGGGIGKAAGTAFGGPIGGALGEAAGKLIGGALDQKQKKIEAANKRTQKSISNIIGQSTGLQVQNQFQSYMQNGGYAQNGIPMSNSVDKDCVKKGTCGKEEAQNKADKAQSKIDAKTNAAYDAAVAREQRAADKQREQEYADYLSERITGYGDKIKQKDFDAAYQTFAAQNPELAKDRLLYTLANKELNKIRNNPDYRMRSILNRTNPMINYGSLTLPQLMQTMQQGYGSGQGYYEAWKSGFPMPKQQDGGETSPYEWVSHTWQPQVIAQFGEHNVKDLLKPPADADMLRAGGHLKEYTPPSAEAMQTDNFAMGGELQTHWGGYAEPLSQNPYLPDGGQTVMFRGQSHDESDGQGNTGIGITYGENPVEVERGEPAVKLQDGGTGENNLTVFGNIKITNAFADMLGDTKAKGKKFKHYVKDLSKQENKQNKLIEKSVDGIDNLDVLSPFDQLALGTYNANLIGANAKLKDLADKKMNAAALQNAINDTKEEEGLVDITDEGDVKAERGARIPKAQNSMNIPFGFSNAAVSPSLLPMDMVRANAPAATIATQAASAPTRPYSSSNRYVPPIEDLPNVSEKDYTDLKTLYDKAKGQQKGDAVIEFQRKFHQLFPEQARNIISKYGPTARARREFKGDVTNLQGNEDRYFGPRTEAYMATAERSRNRSGELPRTAIPNLSYTLPTPSATPSATVTPSGLIPKKPGFDWMGAFNQVLPYLRPSDAEGLDPNQLMGELYALSQNQVEPVWAQKIQPELATPYDISLQDILNENQAAYNATQRQVGYNPAALASLNAQKYAANQKILGEQFRLNQAEKAQVYEANRNILNQAKLQNLGILDKQYERQAEALSKTKATTQAALNSIASKYAQNKLDNRTLAVYENLYNYRYDPKFRAINMNPLAQFNIPTVGDVPATTTKQKTSRNGSIVKNLKTL